MKFAVVISAVAAAPTFDDVQSPLPVIIGGELAAKGNSEISMARIMATTDTLSCLER